jgi:hypothetical protein
MRSYTQYIKHVSIAAVCLLGPSIVSAAYLSQANLYSTIYEDPRNVTVGGWDTPTAELTKTGSATPVAGVSQEVSGWTIASAATGRLAFNLSTAVDLAPDAAIASASTAAIQSTNNTIIDDFFIGAGGGLEMVILQISCSRLNWTVNINCKVGQTADYITPLA